MFNKKIISWSFYDLANTAFSALIVTLFFPVLIKVYMGGNEFQIGLVMGGSLLLSAIFVPFMGSISDALKVKKPFIILFTLLTVIFTILIAYTNLYIALIFGLLANLFYHGCLDIYDSLLYDIADNKKMGKVSGLGTAFGYVGTILSLGMAAIILNQFGWDTEIGTRMIFPATGTFFIIFSMPLFIWVKDKRNKIIDFSKAMKIATKEIKETLYHLKIVVHNLLISFINLIIKPFTKSKLKLIVEKNHEMYKNLWTFMLASLIYVDAVNTLIIFLYLFGENRIGISVKEFFPLFALMAVAAIFGSVLFGYLSDEIGPKKSLVTALILWIFVILMLIIKTNYYTYVTAGMVGGALLGAIWTITRPMLIQLSPKRKITEMFGFQGLTEKLGGFFGPVLFGLLVISYGYTAALISVLVFFILGLGLLLKVKI